MAKKYAWSEHIDDEVWRGGPCDSIRECVEEALAEDFELEDTFAVGLIEEYTINYDFAQDIVERLCEDAYDEVGEASYGWLDSAKRPELDKLNERLIPIIKAWLEEIHELPYFYKVLPSKEYTLSEALEVQAVLTKGGKQVKQTFTERCD